MSLPGTHWKNRLTSVSNVLAVHTAGKLVVSAHQKLAEYLNGMSEEGRRNKEIVQTVVRSHDQYLRILGVGRQWSGVAKIFDTMAKASAISLALKLDKVETQNF